ncbi:hypothetical protein KRMM14A1259_45080 [Krasilnikovia sp. MM14-A1259]
MHHSRSIRRRRTWLSVLTPIALILGAMTGPAAASADPGAGSFGDAPLPSYPGLTPSLARMAADVPTTPLECADNGADKHLTRDQVLTRARSWFAVGGVPYSQDRCYQNQYGDYRTDCSGFVSMAWGLGGKGSGHWTGNLLDRAYQIPRANLQPGDALLRHVGDKNLDHVALFVRWADAAHTRPYVYEQTGSRDTVEDEWSESQAANYTPVRYDNIADETARDFSGDGVADVVARDDGYLRLYEGNGSGGFKSGSGGQIGGAGWGGFSTIFSPGDFNGDGNPDILARDGGTIRFYAGNGNGGFLPGGGQVIGSGGWAGFSAVFSPGDFNGDSVPDVIARDGGALRLWEGNGHGGFLPGGGQVIGSGGWAGFSAVFSPGDFNGDGYNDVIARDGGVLRLYEGNGDGGFKSGSGDQIGGAGWGGFSTIFSPGDFNGDGNPDILARDGGTIRFYAGNGSGGFKSGTGDTIGSSGWGSFTAIF